jgi:hypothetical protein
MAFGRFDFFERVQHPLNSAEGFGASDQLQVRRRHGGQNVQPDGFGRCHADRIGRSVFFDDAVERQSVRGMNEVFEVFPGVGGDLRKEVG